MAGRPQIGIERLPARRMSNEPRESMNCKSCRKRKIKCNRLRPTCEACQVFQCPCLYDAIPKKRGPKTDVLEALLKRVDGLERRLKDEKNTPADESGAVDLEPLAEEETTTQQTQKNDTNGINNESAIQTPSPTNGSSPGVNADVLLDTFFARCHGKAYHILDETTIRQRVQLDQVSKALLHSIYAVSARYTAHPNGYLGAVRLSEDYAMRARAELDVDEPCIESLQALLLLAVSFNAAGNGKKAYMLLTAATGMALALELHRESDVQSRLTPLDREMRRRLFWTCYLMDKFAACGSKRPSLITDQSITLRLPSWCPDPAALPIDGEFFQNGSNHQYLSLSGQQSQGSSGMLIDIVRILGITNKYLAAGGVKGDSHFPWHSLSNLSKIRQDLDIWASGTQDVFSSVQNLFEQPDSTTLVLSKLIYHLVHCLIYRPFLPIDLAELAGTGQHQSWQIEATNMCFLHANAIAELVELGKQSPFIEWPSFVGYCICTAGTVHIHGTHYQGKREGEVFSSSSEFLSQEMRQLSELRYAWSSVQHQRETIQQIYTAHSELVKSLASNPIRYSPVFHLEDFFDRYSDLGTFDGAHLSFSKITNDPNSVSFVGHDIYASRAVGSNNHNTVPSSQPPPKKRRKSSVTRKKQNGDKVALRNHDSIVHRKGTNTTTLMSPTISNIGRHQSQTDHLMLSPPSFQPLDDAQNNSLIQQSRPPFSPPYNFPTSDPYDPLFGMPLLGSSVAASTNDFLSALPKDSLTSQHHESNEFGASSSNGFGFVPDEEVENGEDGTGGEEEEKDPFLSLLEQLAENEHSRGGPSELDFFLSGENG